MLDKRSPLLAERERLLEMIDQESQRDCMDSADLIGMYERQLAEVDAELEGIEEAPKS